jgi:D-arabinose 1-dehydrogenase-like Zn-dependent alcohol dehydrogenase
MLSKGADDGFDVFQTVGVRPIIEKYPLAKASEGYARMMSRNAEFRVVLATRG